MRFLALMSVFLVSACATNVTPMATGGSKSDGTVTLSYEYGMFEKPVVDWTTANATAEQRCKAWHYKNAEAFGGAQNICLAHNGYGDCVRVQVNVTYQCTDK